MGYQLMHAGFLGLQEIAFEKGLIPYVPDEKTEIDSVEIEDDIALDEVQRDLSSERNKKKRRGKSEDPSQQSLDFD